MRKTRKAVDVVVVTHVQAVVMATAQEIVAAALVLVEGLDANTCNIDLCDGQKAHSFYCDPRLPIKMQLLLSCR